MADSGTNDEYDRAYERVQEAQRELDDAWPSRVNDPGRTARAIKKLNDAGAELNRLASSQ